MSTIEETATQPASAEPQTLADFASAAYGELRRIAAFYFKRESKGHMLQPTALVHEVYIRLERNGRKRYSSRAQFFACAARAMRQILVEEARKRSAAKRGGDWQRVDFDGLSFDPAAGPPYVAIDTALAGLSLRDPDLGQVVELRVFAGLATHEIASILRLSPTTVKTRWAVAQAWLKREIPRS